MSDTNEGIIIKPGTSGAFSSPKYQPYNDPFRLATIYDHYDDIPKDQREFYYRGRDGRWHDIDRDPPRFNPLLHHQRG